MPRNPNNPRNKPNNSPADYDKTTQSIIDLIGLEKETRTSSREIAEALGTGESVIQRIRVVLDDLGALTTRFQYKPGGGGGKEAYWTLHHTWPVIQSAMKMAGYDWSQKTLITISKKHNRYPWRKDLRPANIESRVERPADRPAPTERVAVGTSEDGGQMAVVGPDAPSPLAEKFKAAIPQGYVFPEMKPDEARAQVAAARQYANTQAFIDEEIAKFKGMGITLPREAISVPENPVLGIVAQVLPYIDRIESENNRLAAASRATRMPDAEVSTLRQDLAAAKKTIERLQGEKITIQDSVKAIELRHRNTVQSMQDAVNRQERALAESARVLHAREEEVEALRRQLGMKIAADATKSAVQASPQP